MFLSRSTGMRLIVKCADLGTIFITGAFRYPILEVKSKFTRVQAGNRSKMPDLMRTPLAAN